MAYGTGLLAFNEVCKRVETLALHTEDEIRSEHIDSKVSFYLCDTDNELNYPLDPEIHG